MHRILWVLVGLLLMCPYDGFAFSSYELTERKVPSFDGYQISFVNENNQVVIAEDKGYASIVYSFGPGYSIERYLDQYGNPIALGAGQYGRHILSKKDNKQYITYLGMNGAPTMIKYGYATIERTLVDEKEVSVTYLDLESRPVSHSDGYFGYRCEYNEAGYICSVTYLDQHGNTCVTKYGYDEIKREYDAQGRLVLEWYYSDGKQIPLSEGQYGKRFDDDQSILIDKNGQPIFVPTRYLMENLWICWLVAVVFVLVSVLFKRNIQTVALLSYVVFVFFITLFRAKTSASASINPIDSVRFFTDAETRTEIICNVLLFVPLGALFHYFFSQSTTLLLIALTTVAIEVLQFTFQVGVFAVGDMLSNLFGGIVGCIANEKFSLAMMHFGALSCTKKTKKGRDDSDLRV